jgi:Protein of unknown function (DUF2281)
MTALTIDSHSERLCQRLSAKIAALSPDKQQSVLDFIEFLQRQSNPSTTPSVAMAAPQNFTSNDFDDW